MELRPRAVIQAIVGLMLLTGGAGFAGIPDYEISYHYDPPLRFCHDSDGCVVTYELEIGNTGWEKQESVEVVVDSEVLENLLHAPRIRTVSGKRRDILIEEDGSATHLRISNLERGKVIRLQFTRHEPWRAGQPSMAEYLRTVTPAKGVAVHNSPYGVNLARFLFAILAV